MMAELLALVHVLYGPILFIRDVAAQNRIFGICAVLVLLPALIAPIFKRTIPAVAAAEIGAFIWILLGLVGIGIDC